MFLVHVNVSDFADTKLNVVQINFILFYLLIYLCCYYTSLFFNTDRLDVD